MARKYHLSVYDTFSLLVHKYILTKRRLGDSRKIEILGRIHQLSFNIIPATNDLVFEAAEIKADYPISSADSFAVACARDQSAEIVTGDPDFKKVEHLVKIHWI